MSARGNQIPSLAELLEEAFSGDDAVPSSYNMAITSCRIPRPVLDELAVIARSRNMSMSLLINLLLDGYLRGDGRPGYAELAPWYPQYVTRKRPAVSEL